MRLQPFFACLLLVFLVIGCTGPGGDAPVGVARQGLTVTGADPQPFGTIGQTILPPGAATFLHDLTFDIDPNGGTFQVELRQWDDAASLPGAVLASSGAQTGARSYTLAVDQTLTGRVVAILSCDACAGATVLGNDAGGYDDGASYLPGNPWTSNGAVDLAFTATFFRPTSTALAISPVAPVYREPVTLTATVPNGTGGSVVFTDEASNVLGTAAVGAGQTASTTTTALGVGAHTIRATFAQTASQTASTGTANVAVGKATTKVLAPTSSKPTSTVGELVTFSTKVASELWSGTPSGTVTFYVDGQSVGTGTLDGSGNASLQTNRGLTSGPHPVTAQYTSGDDNFLASAISAPTTQTINQDTVDIAIASSENPTTYGKNVTYTATVSPTSTTSGTPEGTIEIFDGATSLGNAEFANGTYTLKTAAPPVGGAHTITASFTPTEVNHAPGSRTYTQRVSPGATSIAIGALAPKEYGAAIAFVATISGPAGATAAPLGRVRFAVDNVTDGSVDLTPGMNGTVTYAPTATLSAGTHRIDATYDPSAAGDLNYASSTTTASQDVTGARTALTLKSSLAPADLGESVTLTATLAAPFNTQLTPTGGRVYFYDDGVALGDALVTAGGIATLTRSFTTATTHPLTAVFTPNAGSNYLTSTGALTLVVRQLDTRVTLTSSGSPSTYGGTVTFTVTVAKRGAAGPTPTGQVTLVEDATRQELGKGNLDASGVIRFDTSALGGGTHNVTATYGGDASYVAGNTASIPHVVSPARPAVTVAVIPASAVFGQSVTVTATVASSAPAARTGNVVFTDGAITLQTVRLDAQSRASFAIATLGAGSHTIKASYVGDANYESASGSSAALPIGKGTTSTELVSSSTPSLIGTSVTFTATVRALAPSAGVPPGNVELRDNGALLARVPLENGIAIFATAALAAGTHPLTATYLESANYLGSTGSFSQRVNTEAATISLAATPKPAPPHGEPVTLTATLTGKLQTPTGAMLFKEGPSSLGAGTLTSGVATYETRTLSAGNHTVTAAYSGDLVYAVGTGAIAVTIGKQTTTTTLSAGDGPAITGTPVTLRAVVASPSTGFTGQVQFMDAQTTLGFGVLEGTTATLIVNGLTAGDHAITAVYGGDDNFTSSTAAPLVLAVGSAVVAGDSDAGTEAPKASADDGGCRASGGSLPVSTTGLALAGLALVRRRRRR